MKFAHPVIRLPLATTTRRLSSLAVVAVGLGGPSIASDFISDKRAK
ncbi:hypothetical protein [Lactiplantibacillus pentosus]|nr:hypothetical protein [Lactiplantibacillus pentosus]MBQ0835551.1 hypothetical protein [Lactiplantibacillus pentosus]MBU7464164.1 hypothetical protein [Lactiplantibacillus pentosus]MBU7489537.1 hypothetical protein [Lactiplantibacillus pentosus]MBU7491992.1 hypothetical protein [Lactiplantibacillus pentosus]MBU7518154.1 hypothetical protein [Lactiplantibacillus pentosus]